MKKKVLSAISAIVVVASASAMAAGQWVCIQDKCGKCVINDTERECGRCGGFMNSGDGEYVGNGFVKSTYTCKSCGHAVIYKNK